MGIYEELVVIAAREYAKEGRRPVAQGEPDMINTMDKIARVSRDAGNEEGEVAASMWRLAQETLKTLLTRQGRYITNKSFSEPHGIRRQIQYQLWRIEEEKMREWSQESSSECEQARTGPEREGQSGELLEVLSYAAAVSGNQREDWKQRP